MSVSKTLRARSRGALIAAIIAAVFGVTALAGSDGRWYPVHTFFALTVACAAFCSLVCYALAVRHALPVPPVTHPRVTHPRPSPTLTAIEQR